ncbi:MAG: transcriptional regulator NrdR [Candidatus Omnitrophica bacterium]|nr:transcriptional regulator NrdR [Candidatus Omnitrophota bacterium]
MKCPFCKKKNDKVIDSRLANNGEVIRRRRECLKCKRRFTTYEHTEEAPFMVVKKDLRREQYDRKKALAGLIKACEKRPVPLEALEKCVDELEKMLEDTFTKEVLSTEIGEFFMRRLSDIDEVAYVRFASVYRQFKDINQFMSELKILLAK